ncbi:MAG: hypothetical protein KGI27_09890 [Thaumarchaeota archaeon]|nr:hypothetical protein [Nitrososphaerota archaeon]
MTRSDQLVAVAKAEDTYDLLQHIAWEKIIKPALDQEVKKYSELLVAEALGTSLPGGLTREQVAGRCYGIHFVSSLFEKILQRGEKALEDLQGAGIKVQ